METNTSLAITTYTHARHITGTIAESYHAVHYDYYNIESCATMKEQYYTLLWHSLLSARNLDWTRALLSYM